MPETNEREALARLIFAQCYETYKDPWALAWAWDAPGCRHSRGDAFEDADAILASDWLKAHTAAAVEAERAACEAVVREMAATQDCRGCPNMEPNVSLNQAADAIAARKAPE